MKGDLFGIITVVFCTVIITIDARPWYIGCTDSSECGLDSCCVLGGGRFSIPRCVALNNVNDVCNPTFLSPRNATVSYPDGENVELTNIFSIMCPCQPGLFCSQRTGTCQSLSESVIFNTLY